MRLEDVVDNEALYALAAERLNFELTKKLPAALQKELANLKEMRRLDSLPSFTGRQTLCYALLRQFFRSNTDYESSAAQDSM